MEEIWCMIEISQALLMFLWWCRHSFIIHFLHKKYSLFRQLIFLSHSTSSTNMMMAWGQRNGAFHSLIKTDGQKKGSAATTSTCHHHHRYEMVLTHSFHCILTRRGSYIVCASMFLSLNLFSHTKIRKKSCLYEITQNN